MSDNNTPTLPVGLQIARLRRRRGWSLAALARRAGTSAPSLHRYEGGWDRFELSTLRRIAAALGARLDVRLVPVETRAGDRSKPSRKSLASLLAPLFWEHQLEPDDLERYPEWVARRALMFGDLRQAAAVREYFGDSLVRRSVEHREVDPRTRNFWRLLLE